MVDAPITRYLLVMRHATSGMAQGVTPDFERTLTEAGLAEAARVGAQIATMKQLPKFYVVCSKARRARQTLDAVLTAGVRSVHADYAALFYQGSVDQVLASLWEVPNTEQGLMIVGHNPTWSELATFLSADLVSLAPANAVLLTRASPSWEEALSSPGWEIARRFEP